MKKIIAVLALALLAPACVSKSQIKTAHDAGFQEANTQCLTLQGQVQGYLSQLQVQLATYRERLAQFNQVNADGSLRYKAAPAPAPQPAQKAGAISIPASATPTAAPSTTPVATPPVPK